MLFIRYISYIYKIISFEILWFIQVIFVFSVEENKIKSKEENI